MLRLQNLSIPDSRNIFIESSQTPCIDSEATSDVEIAFEIEGKIRRYRLPPLDLNIVHIRPDGTPRPMPIGSNLVLSHQARGGALRVRSDDSEAELEIPGRARFKPFRGGRANTISLRGLNAGWLRLHRGMDEMLIWLSQERSMLFDQLPLAGVMEMCR